jgi:hypothetical protein
MNEADVTSAAEETLTCRWHPQTETGLRCYRCGTPICSRCAQRTSVGYICPACQKGTKRRYERARLTDYIIAGIVSLVLGGLAGWFLPAYLGWFVLFLSPLSGTLTAEAVWRLTGRRYSDWTWRIVAGGLILGALPRILLTVIFSLMMLGSGNPWGLLDLVYAVGHVLLAVGAATARLRLR